MQALRICSDVLRTWLRPFMSRIAALHAELSATQICPRLEHTGSPHEQVLPLSLSPQPCSDRSWAKRIRAGDREAFGALFHALHPSLCSMVARRIGSPEIAEELVQDLFVRVWERRAELDPAQSVTRYLYRAARNQALNHLKHSRIVRRSHDAIGARPHPTTPTPDDYLRYTELASAAHEAIEQLPDRCRDIFLLSRQGELKYAEIARLLGLSVKTVETQMGRALKALRIALSPYL